MYIFFEGFALWSPSQPTEGLTEHPDTQLYFIFQFMENADFFPSWLTSRSLYLLSQKSISFSYYFYLSMSQAYEAGLSFSHTCSFSDASASLQGLKLFFSYIPILVKYQSINKPVFFIWEDMSQFSQDINTSAFLMHPPDLSYGDLLLKGNTFIKVSFVPY